MHTYYTQEKKSSISTNGNVDVKVKMGNSQTSEHSILPEDKLILILIKIWYNSFQQNNFYAVQS